MAFTFDRKPGSDQYSNSIEGLWSGVYRINENKESVVVRFEDNNQVVLFSGLVEEDNKFTGTWEVKGDSVLVFKYVDTEGKKFIMKGNINKRKTYVDGYWEVGDKKGGSFYLRKEKVQERFI